MKTLFKAQEALFTYSPDLEEELLDLHLVAGKDEVPRFNEAYWK